MTSSDKSSYIAHQCVAYDPIMSGKLWDVVAEWQRGDRRVLHLKTIPIGASKVRSKQKYTRTEKGTTDLLLEGIDRES